MKPRWKSKSWLSRLASCVSDRAAALMSCTPQPCGRPRPPPPASCQRGPESHPSTRAGRTNVHERPICTPRRIYSVCSSYHADSRAEPLALVSARTTSRGRHGARPDGAARGGWVRIEKAPSAAATSFCCEPSSRSTRDVNGEDDSAQAESVQLECGARRRSGRSAHHLRCGVAHRKVRGQRSRLQRHSSA